MRTGLLCPVLSSGTPGVLRDASALRASRVQLIDAESKYRHLTSGWAMLGRRAAARAPATSPAPGHARVSLPARRGSGGGAALLTGAGRAGMAAGDCSRGSAPLRSAPPPRLSPRLSPRRSRRSRGRRAPSPGRPRPRAPPRRPAEAAAGARAAPRGRAVPGSSASPLSGPDPPPDKPGLVTQAKGIVIPAWMGRGGGPKAQVPGMCGCPRTCDLTDLVEIRRGDSRGTTGAGSWDPPKPRSGYRWWQMQLASCLWGKPSAKNCRPCTQKSGTRFKPCFFLCKNSSGSVVSTKTRVVTSQTSSFSKRVRSFLP